MTARLRMLGAFTGVVLRQLRRDRSSLFFMAVLPVGIIAIVGTTFGGERRLAVGLAVPANSMAADRLRTELDRDDGIRVRRYDDEAALARAVRRFTVAGGLVVPTDADQHLAAGANVSLRLLSLPTSDAAVTVREALAGAAARAGMPIAVAQHLTATLGGTYEERFADASAAAESIPPPVEVRAVVVAGDGATRAPDDSAFGFTAAQNLVLFTFINALTSAGVLVKARRTGIFRRALAAPAGPGTLVAGMALAWFVLALAQSAIILVVGRVAFGVDWGAPLPAAALVAVFAAVGCGAGLLTGALANDEDRASALTPPIGIAAGALGGCMVPLEVFPDGMRTVARALPHSWAMDAWQTLMVDDGRWADIAGALGVLAAYAALLLAAAVVTTRRRLRRA